MRYLVVILLLSSCVTENKARHWMDEHPYSAATYCADKFPIWEHSDTVIQDADVSPYDSAFNELWGYIDRLREYNASIDSIIVIDSIRTIFRDRYVPYVQTKTITITRRDSSEITKHLEQIKALQRQLSVTQKVANAKITKILGIAIGALVTMAYQIRRLIRKTKK